MGQLQKEDELARLRTINKNLMSLIEERNQQAKDIIQSLASLGPLDYIQVDKRLRIERNVNIARKFIAEITTTPFNGCLKH